VAEKYSARLATQPKCGHWPDQIVLDGPALRENMRDQMADLAYSILDGDGRAEAWGDYLVALGNLKAATADDAPDAQLEHLADRVSDAWEALEPELNMSLYLRMPDARAVTHVIDDMAGRVGIEGRRPA
jgi:hypothetical protein